MGVVFVRLRSLLCQSSPSEASVPIEKRNVESLIELLYKTCRARIEERMGK